MKRNRMLWVWLTVLVGGLQSLDSGVLRAGSAPQALVALGVISCALALAMTERRAVWVTGLVAGAGLLAWARAISPVSLNALHIGLMVPAMYIFFVHRLERNVAQDPGATTVRRV